MEIYEWKEMEAAYWDWLKADSDEDKKRHNIALRAVIQQLNRALPGHTGGPSNSIIVEYCVNRLEQLFEVYTTDLERGRIMLERGRGLYALGREEEAIIAFQRSAEAYCSLPHEYGICNYIRGFVLWKNTYPIEAFCAWKLTLDAFRQAIGQPDGEQKMAEWYKERIDQLKKLMRDLMEYDPDQPIGPSSHPRRPPGWPPRTRPAPKPPEPSTGEAAVRPQAPVGEPAVSVPGSVISPAQPGAPVSSPDFLPVIPGGEKADVASEDQEHPPSTPDETIINWGYLLGLPIVGEVPAGGFGPAGVNGSAIEYADFDQVIIHGHPYRFLSLDRDRRIRFDRKTDFLLQVRGNSMDRARPYEIKDGDYVLVHPQAELADGLIVVAVIQGIDTRSTLKRYQMRGSVHMLVPESSDPSYTPFEIKPEEPSETAQILGVVLAILKPEK